MVNWMHYSQPLGGEDPSLESLKGKKGVQRYSAPPTTDPASLDSSFSPFACFLSLQVHLTPPFLPLSVAIPDSIMTLARRANLMVFGFALLLLLICGDAFAPAPGKVRNFARSGLSMSKDEGMTEEERTIAIEKATKAMTAFTNKYLENTHTYLCSDSSIPAVVIKGLAENKVTLGAPLCPCRFYEDKEKEAKDGFWNCPCVPMRERHECHCMLFLTEDNDFVGNSQHITVDEVISKTENFEA